MNTCTWTREEAMFVMSDCSAATQTLARSWISTVMGAVHDDGHVEAICNKMAASLFRSTAALVNTMAYLPRHDAEWNMYQNFGASSTRTYVWPNFQFMS